MFTVMIGISVLVILVADFAAIQRIISSVIYSRRQKALQIILTVFLPVLGAALVIYFSKPRSDPSMGEFPPAPPANRDAMIGSTSNFRP